MSEDRSSNGQKSWLGKLTQAFAHEPKNRQELLELLRDAHQNKLLDSEALAIVEGAIQVADLQVRDIMVPRSQMISIKATQTPREFLPAIIEAAHSRYPVIGESHDDVLGVLLAMPFINYAMHPDRERAVTIDPVPTAKRVVAIRNCGGGTAQRVGIWQTIRHEVRDILRISEFTCIAKGFDCLVQCIIVVGRVRGGKAKDDGLGYIDRDPHPGRIGG